MDLGVLVTILCMVGIYTIGLFTGVNSTKKELNRDNEILFKQYSDVQGKVWNLEQENRELKEQNVSRETSYNPSYGTPEVIDWINQTGEDAKRG